MFQESSTKNKPQTGNYEFSKGQALTALYACSGNDLSTLKAQVTAAIQTALDLSFDQGLQQQNAKFVWDASIKYLKDTIKEPIDEEFGFMDACMKIHGSQEQKGSLEIPDLIFRNRLLSEQGKKSLINFISQEKDLIGFLTEIQQIFGQEISEEIFYIVQRILSLKYQSFKLKMNCSALLPHFNCFWGEDEDIQFFSSSCPVYEDVSCKDVKDEAEKGVKELSEELDSEIKILNVSQFEVERKPHVDLGKKFTKLVVAISQAVFLTIMGQTTLADNAKLDDSFQISDGEEEIDEEVDDRHIRERPDVQQEDKELYATFYSSLLKKRVKNS